MRRALAGVLALWLAVAPAAQPILRAAALGAVGVVRVWRSAPEDGPGPGAERSPGP